MKLGIGAVVFAGALLGAAAFLPAVSEGAGGSAGAGCGGCRQDQTQCQKMSANCPQGSQRQRGGSCGNANCPQKGATQRTCPGPAGQGAATLSGGGNGTPPATE